MEGIGFFETYASVVQWKMVRLMLILEVLVGLKSKQGNFTTAFLHAYIPENKKVHVEIPRVFEQFSNIWSKKWFETENMLYGLRQSPRVFWKYLTKKLEQSGLKQSKFDP